jgi:single-strand DNA-binding protein
MNSVSLVGMVAEHPRLRVADDGEEICTIRLAVPRVGRGGLREPGVVYVDIAAGGWQAREICERAVIGGRIGVAGRIEHDEWVEPDGERRTRCEVLADQLELLDAPPPEPPSGAVDAAA